MTSALTLSPGVRMRDLLRRNAAIAVIIVVIAVFAVANPNFLTGGNLMSILLSITVSAFLALAVTFSLVVDGFDVSIGSTTSLATIAAASVMIEWRGEAWLAILVPILCGVAVGLVNGFLIVKLGLPDLLATLAMLFVISGVQRTLTGGKSITASPDSGIIVPSFSFIGKGTVFGIPFPVVLLVVVAVLAWLFLSRTTLGRSMYLVGGNEEAARHLGLPVGRLRVLAYVISGVLASIGGIVLTARIGAGQIEAGAPLLMDAVAAAYVGYALFGQKKPSVVGTVLGAVLIGVLLNGLTMLKFPYFAQDIVKGGVFIMALAFAFVQTRRTR
ncbi:ABC transporter permease [Salinibacterium sp. ZJ77]|uniref:ABC transporter permease n=1 Tax=Salinibacterium sp. ZJ77 TaxID=2708337 RepID=UPI001AB022C6|nr:ABC transporter permease [Salinibacterium sp. ZJ77]